MKGRLASKIKKGGWEREEKEAPGNPPQKKEKRENGSTKIDGLNYFGLGIKMFPLF